MKEVTDTKELRNRIQECFELASLPGVTEVGYTCAASDQLQHFQGSVP